MTRMIEAEVAVPADCELGEGPVWDATRGLLVWVDILAGHVHAIDPSTGVHTWFDAGNPVGAAGLTRSGRLVLALADGFALADHDGQGLTRVPGFAVDRTVIRFNDGKPDPWGNFSPARWRGTSRAARPAACTGSARTARSPRLFGDVGLSNGLDWSDDRRIFYYADSNSGGVDVFDTDPDTGALANRGASCRSRPPTASPTASRSTPKAASGSPSGTPASCAVTRPTAASTPWSACPPAR